MEQQNTRTPRAATTGRASRASRRLTAIDLRGVRNSIYATAAAGIQFMSIDPEYDPERYSNDVPHPTRQSKQGGYLSQRGYNQQSWLDTYAPSPALTETPNPFDDNAHIVGVPSNQGQNPFDDSNTIIPPPVIGQVEKSSTVPPPPPPPEQPYHVFSKGRKMVLIGTIGVAGLFSGLSSNIYFPALDSIAKVITRCPKSNQQCISFFLGDLVTNKIDRISMSALTPFP